ncbi:MAG: DUF4260 family protein [Thermoleophilia bacterium]
MSAALAPLLTSARRPAYAAAAALLAAGAVATWLLAGSGGWIVLAFAIAPDLALPAGGGRGLDRGQLHPRAVPLYNALHRLWGPVVLAAVALAGLLPAAWLAAALAWAAHIALDRAAGYGLRAPDGRQRA